MFQGRDKLLSVEKLLPKSSQQPETALRCAANRWSGPFQRSQPLVLGDGLAIKILVILFALINSRVFCLWLV